MQKVGSQSIYCNVVECRNNQGGEYCRLDTIRVANDTSFATDVARSQHDSMCGSFATR
ncbi:MAG: DUF1540 domain-containing protein [Christensenellales bacterium]